MAQERHYDPGAPVHPNPFFLEAEARRGLLRVLRQRMLHAALVSCDAQVERVAATRPIVPEAPRLVVPAPEASLAVRRGISSRAVPRRELILRLANEGRSVRQIADELKIGYRGAWRAIELAMRPIVGVRHQNNTEELQAARRKKIKDVRQLTPIAAPAETGAKLAASVNQLLQASGDWVRTIKIVDGVNATPNATLGVLRRLHREGHVERENRPLGSFWRLAVGSGDKAQADDGR